MIRRTRHLYRFNNKQANWHAPPPPKAEPVFAPNPKAGADWPNKDEPVVPAAAELLKEKAGTEAAPKAAADGALKPNGVPVPGVPNAAEDAPKAGAVDPNDEAAELCPKPPKAVPPKAGVEAAPNSDEDACAKAGAEAAPNAWLLPKPPAH